MHILIWLYLGSLGGIINDQNVYASSKLYTVKCILILSDDTKLTIGARYQDDDVLHGLITIQVLLTGCSGGWLVE